MVKKKLFENVMNKNNLYIGILTGTSMDSIDCGIFGFDSRYKLISFYENNYPLKLKKKIKENYGILTKDFANNILHKELSEVYSDIVNKIILKENINKKNISAIGMHGQTISHGKYNNKNISLQLGCPLTLSKMTNLKVVSDFRQHDINNGGEGAPLAPLFHDYFFNNSIDRRIIINIGGISNISFLTNKKNNLFGFDSGPGNTLIDIWVNKKYNQDYDVDGKISSEYSSSENLLKIFLSDKYFKKNFPKSTTTEYFNYNWILSKIKLANTDFSDGDVLATLTKLTAISIAQSIKNCCMDFREIYVCGGGAFNKTILSHIRSEVNKEFPNNIIVETTEKIGLPPKIVESCLFAWLAMSKLNNKILDYRMITGAKKTSTLGKIYSFK